MTLFFVAGPRTERAAEGTVGECTSLLHKRTAADELFETDSAE